MLYKIRGKSQIQQSEQKKKKIHFQTNEESKISIGDFIFNIYQ